MYTVFLSSGLWGIRWRRSIVLGHSCRYCSKTDIGGKFLFFAWDRIKKNLCRELNELEFAAPWIFWPTYCLTGSTGSFRSGRLDWSLIYTSLERPSRNLKKTELFPCALDSGSRLVRGMCRRIFPCDPCLTEGPKELLIWVTASADHRLGICCLLQRCRNPQ